MIRRLPRRLPPLVLALLTGAAVIAGGAVYAYWTAHGAGSGNALTGQAAHVTAQPLVDGTATVATELVPGGTADLLIALDNPNDFPLTITGVAQNGTVVVTNGGTCTASTAGVSVPTSTVLAVTLPANASTVLHLSDAVAMATSSDNGCQGKQFGIPVTLTVRK